MVYVVVISGVYDRGVLGVFETQAEAEAAIERIHQFSDGYHHYDVRPYELGAVYDLRQVVRGYRGRTTDKPPAGIDIVDPELKRLEEDGRHMLRTDGHWQEVELR